MEDKRVVYLLSSAVVTAPGVYRYRHIGPAEAQLIYHTAPRIISGVGYEATARVMEMLLGLQKGTIKVTRTTTIFRPGDKAIVFRLTKRIEDDKLKGKLTVEEVLNWPHELGLLERLE